MAVREPFRRASWRVVAGHAARLPSRMGSMHCANESDAEPNTQVINPLGFGTRRSYSTSWCGKLQSPLSETKAASVGAGGLAWAHHQAPELPASPWAELVSFHSGIEVVDVSSSQHG